MNVNEAIEYLKKQNLDGMEVGRYDVDSDFFFMVQEYTTKQRKDARLEAHEQWIDIQWMVKGEEMIEVDDISRLTIQDAYNESNDVVFFEKPDVLSQIRLTKGTYVVLYPRNGHMPSVAVDDQPASVKKVVGKVRVK